MFFATREIKAAIIDLDGFAEHEGALDTVEAVLSELNLPYVFVSATAPGSDDARNALTVFAESIPEFYLFHNVIRRAVLRLEVPPSRCVLIAASGDHLRNAHELLLGTIVIADWERDPREKVEVYQQFPDFIVHAKDLKAALTGGRLGYAAEFSAAPPDVFIFPQANVAKGNRSFYTVPNLRHPDTNVIVAGRYFDTTDPRFYLHPLSVRIVNSKKYPERQAACFGAILLDAMSLVNKIPFDVITWIPPRPGKTDRLGLYLTALKADYGNYQISEEQLRPDALFIARNYESLKGYNFADRQAMISGAFGADAAIVSGKRVVVFDDVQTTGATLNEAIGALKTAGAASIVPIALAYHPYAIQTLSLRNEAEIISDCCKEPLVPRCNTRTGQPFYGCSGWRPGDARGKHTDKSFVQAIELKLSKMEATILKVDEELAAFDVEF